MKLKQTAALLIASILISSPVLADQHKNKGEAVKAVQQQITEDQKAAILFDQIFEQAVSRNPVFLTFLGRDQDMDKWNDLSEAFQQQTLDLNKQNLAKVEGLDRSKLSESNQLSYDLMKQSLENDIADYQWRLYNYPVNQIRGTHTSVVSLLINQHRIKTVKNAEDYIARLNNISGHFDQLIENLKARAKQGITPPKFMFPQILTASNNIITGAPFDDGKPSTLLTDFSSKVNRLDVSDQQKSELIKQATQALTTSVKPAYQKLISYLNTLEQQANTDDGAWKWKDGDKFYQNALNRTTTTNLSPEEIHQLGLSEVKRIHDEMRVIKDKVDFKGSLPEFMQFMRNADQFYYPATDEGKQRYLKEATELIEVMKGELDKMFTVKPKADITVKAVEAFREKSAGKAFYQSPSEDGSRPGVYYANLYDMKSMPTYQMEALAYHEGIPGHHMQLAISQELKDIPKFRRFGRYTAYSEGWGLYSELLPKEFGFYSDPYSDFGRLAMELWRACRLVVDTGIHSKKWTREQGIEYYVDNTPNARADAVKMVERHIAWPSQATAYKVGMIKIVELRENAKQKLGDKFDIRGFHDTILKYGPVPLNVLEKNIDDWITETKNS